MEKITFLVIKLYRSKQHQSLVSLLTGEQLDLKSLVILESQISKIKKFVRLDLSAVFQQRLVSAAHWLTGLLRRPFGIAAAANIKPANQLVACQIFTQAVYLGSYNMNREGASTSRYRYPSLEILDSAPVLEIPKCVTPSLSRIFQDQKPRIL